MTNLKAKLETMKEYLEDKQNLPTIAVVGIIGTLLLGGAMWLLIEYAWLLALAGAFGIVHYFDEKDKQEQQLINQQNQQSWQANYEWQTFAENVILPIERKIYNDPYLTLTDVVLRNNAMYRGFAFQLQANHDELEQKKIRNDVLYAMSKAFDTTTMAINHQYNIVVHTDFIEIFRK